MKKVILVLEVADADAEVVRAGLTQYMRDFRVYHTVPYWKRILFRQRIGIRCVSKSNHTPAESHELITGIPMSPLRD